MGSSRKKKKILQNAFYLAKLKLYPLNNDSIPFSPPVPGNHHSIYITVNVTTLDKSGKWNPTVQMTSKQHGFKLNGSTYSQIFFNSKYYSDTYCKVDWVCGRRNVVIYGWLQVTCADFQLHGDGCPNSLIVPGSIVFVLLWLADWLIWLSVRSSSFIHIVACIRISHFFFSNNGTLCLYITFCLSVHLLMDPWPASTF